MTSALIDELANATRASARAAAARRLGRVGGESARRALEAALQADSESVRMAAAHALGRVADPQSATPLEEALEDPVPGVRARAAEALGRVGTPLVAGRLAHVVDSDPVDTVRRYAVTALGWLRAREQVEAALCHADWDVRRRAARSLALIGDPRALPSLERARQSERNFLVRRQLRFSIRHLRRKRMST